MFFNSRKFVNKETYSRGVIITETHKQRSTQRDAADFACLTLSAEDGRSRKGSKMELPVLCGIFNKKDKQVKHKDRTPLKQRMSYCTGHIFNDLCSAVWFTYFIVYFNKVVGLSTTDTGLLFLIAQGADAILTPFMGLGCDRLVIKRFTPYGKRKTWHLFGTVFVAIAWPFIMSPCLACASNSPSWLPMVYYSATVVIFHVGWAGVQIAHLSLIPEIAKRPGEIVELNAVR